MESQCSFSSRGVEWWWWGAKRTSLASKFSIFWRGWMTELGVPMSFVLVIKGSSQLAEKHVALARIGLSATTWCLFLSWRKRKWRKSQRIMGNSSHVTHCFDSNLTHHYTNEVSWVCWVLSAPLSGCQSWPDVRYCRKRNWLCSQNLTRKVTCMKHIYASSAWV